MFAFDKFRGPFQRGHEVKWPKENLVVYVYRTCINAYISYYPVTLSLLVDARFELIICQKRPKLH